MCVILKADPPFEDVVDGPSRLRKAPLRIAEMDDLRSADLHREDRPSSLPGIAVVGEGVARAHFCQVWLTI